MPALSGSGAPGEKPLTPFCFTASSNPFNGRETLRVRHSHEELAPYSWSDRGLSATSSAMIDLKGRFDRSVDGGRGDEDFITGVRYLASVCLLLARSSF